jgi:hypothetical protein
MGGIRLSSLGSATDYSGPAESEAHATALDRPLLSSDADTTHRASHSSVPSYLYLASDARQSDIDTPPTPTRTMPTSSYAAAALNAHAERMRTAAHTR